MKAEFSPYLSGIADGMKKFIAILNKSFDYVSVLSTDSIGWRMSVSKRVANITNRTMTTERGNVVRVCKDGLYSEYSFNEFDPENPEKTADLVNKALLAQFALIKATGTEVYKTGVLSDEPCTLFTEFATEETPEGCDEDKVMAVLSATRDKVLSLEPSILEVFVNAQSTHISKMFLTANRDMRQSYVYSEGMIVPVMNAGGKNVMSYNGKSGRVGPELFNELTELAEDAVKNTKALCNAKPVEPGVYDVITAPEVTGLIAHEAFGHGVEMDMFVKDRALGAKYIGKRVGSDMVTMHEGAKCAVDVTSYAFDDEGTLAGDVTEIDHGILKTGICDALSALRLGTKPTGNGKRENFEHKVYTRMTNTVFDSGDSTLDEMIASIKSGYLLKGMASGMEDPKHWGIQCLVECGLEIKDGELTGNIVAPIVMTGYVPDLLGSVSMCSKDREVFGNGGCGKGYKEWVKVSDGGPYLKARARLG